MDHHHRQQPLPASRLAFARNWLDEPDATHADLLVIEMYPWHSTTLTARLRAPADIIDRFVWQPIAELPTTHVFAFGRPWYDLANNLDLPLTNSLGHGGRPYGSAVPSRAVRVYALPSGQQLVVEMAHRQRHTTTRHGSSPIQGRTHRGDMSRWENEQQIVHAFADWLINACFTSTVHSGTSIVSPTSR